jgi:hypothetical protein
VLPFWFKEAPRSWPIRLLGRVDLAGFHQWDVRSPPVAPYVVRRAAAVEKLHARVVTAIAFATGVGADEMTG